MLLGMLFFAIPVKESGNINYSNFQFARDAHQYWLEKGDAPEWDADWIIAYQAYLDEQDGKVIDYEVPDIKTKWQNREYK